MAAEKKKRTKAPRNPEAHGADAPNPVWFKPVMFGFMLIGLIWALGSWNILVGFGIAFIGFLMTTRWR